MTHSKYYLFEHDELYGSTVKYETQMYQKRIYNTQKNILKNLNLLKVLMLSQIFIPLIVSCMLHSSPSRLRDTKVQ